ncbi:MAG: tRNA (N(6)-L-threonylcarbamoyladenosine(37)-C(2))-methylthiotransferase [Candidatus Aenigmarchaeota archaeon]|nr:tRNA (N(6)-L-threonylcarbamoyladenosine(37)-C(2))-methylthiotransferase [Candidatus Aenigmarchaeota archaeon]
MNRIYIETYGCANNMAESQIMAGILTRNNFEIINNIELSDVVILNTCSVKNATINKIICRMREIQKKYPGKKLIISGCMPETEYDLIIRTAPDASIVSTNHITKITKAVTEKSRVEFIGSNKEIKVCLPKIRNNRVIDIVPVCSGCASFCSFCSTKLAKGNVFSYPEDKIIGEISDAKKFGAKEFWITGQDVSAYGLDTNEISLLPELINKITERVGGKYFLRIGMLNPRHVIPILNKLIKSYKSDNVFKFLHLPVQTGSDRILKKMNRGYKAEDFVEIVERFRRLIPDITVWTDIITGFPEETENDFGLSVKIVEMTRPDFVNISKFSSHRNTPASKLKQVSSELKKERSRLLTDMTKKISKEKNEKWIGWKGAVLIDEFNRKRQNWIGRNFAYKPVAVLTKERLRLGQFVDVEIIDAKPSCLIGVSV